jgi:hypothetical protein
MQPDVCVGYVYKLPIAKALSSLDVHDFRENCWRLSWYPSWSQPDDTNVSLSDANVRNAKPGRSPQKDFRWLRSLPFDPPSKRMGRKRPACDRGGV